MGTGELLVLLLVVVVVETTGRHSLKSAEWIIFTIGEDNSGYDEIHTGVGGDAHVSGDRLQFQNALRWVWEVVCLPRDTSRGPSPAGTATFAAPWLRSRYPVERCSVSDVHWAYAPA